MTKWVTKIFGEMAHINRGGSPRPIDAFVTDREDGINWIKIGDIDPDGKYVNSTSERIISEGKCHSREVRKGDFILSNSMSFGRPYILNIDGCIHDGWLAIQDYETYFDTNFLYYLLSSDIVKKQYSSMASGSTVLNLNKEKVARLQITIPINDDGTPDLIEQRRIAGVLSSADGAIAASEALIEKYRNIKRGLLATLLQPKEGWKKVKLGECAQINRGGSPRPIDAFVTDSEDGINWIKIGDIAPNGKYVNTTSEKIIPEGKQHSREVHKGDFILSNSMSFGRPYILNIDGCIHDGWLAIQDYEETFDTDFLYYMLSSDIVKKQYLAMASGSTVLNLNKEKVAKVILTIPFTSEGTPDLMEQKRIASILSSIDAKINIEEDVVEKYKGVKKGLMEELLKSEK